MTGEPKASPSPSSPAGWARRIRAARRPAGFLRLSGILAFAVAGLPFLWVLLLPWPITLRWANPTETAFMDYRLDEARRAGTDLAIQQEWVPLAAISPDLLRAVRVAEDDRFYRHHGIDWRALAEEVEYPGDTVFSWWSGDDLAALRASVGYVLTHRNDIKGRSTITQQLAKNLYFSPERSFRRKVAEAVVARRLEAFLSKDRILELYLNLVEWGPGIFGAEEAARLYFHRSAAELNLEQAAALAATLPHPLTSNPSFRPGRMEWRKGLILRRLRPASDSLSSEGETGADIHPR